jgi:hypothetical protein
MEAVQESTDIVKWEPVKPEVFGHAHDLSPYQMKQRRRKMRRMAGFLRTYRATGSKSESMRLNKVLPSSLSQWCKDEPLFLRKLEDLEDTIRFRLVEGLEREAIRRGVKGVRTPLVSMGQVVAYTQKHSDKLLEVMLRAKDPEHYAPKVQGQSMEIGKKEDGSTYVKAYVGFNPDDV